ncbi:hypothetical protein Leryth_020940 [Lithospermum erythrorhizon]|nr:hypothetical protein Leryth_020940 [Lithospermum erythrorhizon]
MRPLQVNGDDENGKKQSSPSSHLKMNKGSYSIKKPPQSPLSSPQRRGAPRHPVIIYTHSPKVIHANPKDFMTLVQKLTGLPRSEDNNVSTIPNSDVEKNDDFKRSIPKKTPFILNDNQPSPIMIDDNMCYAQQFYDPLSASFDNMSFYNNINSTDSLGYNYSNSSLLLMPNMRSSPLSPTSGILQDFSEF